MPPANFHRFSILAEPTKLQDASYLWWRFLCRCKVHLMHHLTTSAIFVFYKSISWFPTRGLWPIFCWSDHRRFCNWWWVDFCFKTYKMGSARADGAPQRLIIMSVIGNKKMEAALELYWRVLFPHPVRPFYLLQRKRGSLKFRFRRTSMRHFIEVMTSHLSLQKFN